jgi:SAM-dependent methyltransferase
MNEHHHDALPDILDLDAEVLAGALRDVHREIAELADAPVRTILDLGAGTGAGTLGLLHHFEDARAVAVDASDHMLDHLARRAAGLGLSGRVTTVRADLDEGLPVIEQPVDLAWASASLHHLADPDRVLRKLVPAIRPGGLLAVVELAGFPRFVPDGAEGATAEARAHTLMAADRATDMPTMGDDWGHAIASAGLHVETARAIEIDLAPPLPPAARAYAGAILTRIRPAVADRMDATELAGLDRLLDGGPHDVRHRADLRVTTTRRLWLARRLTG